MRKVKTSVFVALTLSFVAAGALAEQPAIQSENYAHPQRLVVIDGHRRLNVFCLGQGTPTVLFDAGSGDTTASWRYVQGEVAKTTRACSYDRAGYGFSDPPPGASDVNATARDIHLLLRAMGTDGPIIYVGHSVAGLYGVGLQGKYPADVAAMVLVDPSYADMGRWPAPLDPTDQPPPPWAPLAACLALAKSGELQEPKTDAAKACVRENRSLDDVLRRTDKLQQANPVTISTKISEIQSMTPSAPSWISVNTAQIDALNPQFGDKPLIILTHGNMPLRPGDTPDQHKQNEDKWIAAHARLAALSRRGRHIVVPDSRHYIQINQPKAVIDAIEQTVADVRTK
ncbi:alpha/beta hydrolase [Asticcacaulis sp. BYS171W]|uniref:Alpha/beta hydrolase n=1 Tax=Asticcacaulis aquaticus TaxID=2984212 RepID=A0ABT5HUI0_9CAUL|nr:alpha/beta hydrolase [Asticcacaulis aquaticus]MDC7683634.1 alpha/beta hydrolase [Asticcacaulis aquaticus]